MKTSEAKKGGEEVERDLHEMVQLALRALARRRWLIALVTSTFALGATAVSLLLPNRYTSEATIFAVQQRVPERYVTPTSNSDPGQALEAMIQEIFSRPRLLEVVDQLGLNPETRKRLPPEALIDLVRRDLTIQPVRRMLGRGEGSAFRISFVAATPQVAQAVTRRLTTFVIEENLRSRADQAATTTNFLREQLESTQQSLTEKEQELREFKMKYLGQLPEQQEGNLGILAGLHAQLDSVMARRSQAQQQRLYLESLVGEYDRRSRRQAHSVVGEAEARTPLQAARAELVRLQTERSRMLAAYTPQHPEVARVEALIATQQGIVRGLSDPALGSSPGQDQPGDGEQDMVVAQLRSQLRANAAELEDLNQKDRRLRSQIAEYETRLNLIPVREQQLASIQRDYDLVKQHYSELLRKEQESQLAQDLEKRQEGQQFRLAEPPSFPTMPSSPKRGRISLAGLLAGGVFGCLLALVIELRRPALWTEDDGRRLELPIVVGVPWALSPEDERRRTVMRACEWVGASVVVCIIGLAEFYIYRHG